MKVIINQNMSKKTFVIITICSIILGLIVLYSSMRPFIETKVLKTSEKTTGKIYYSKMEAVKSNFKNRSSNRRAICYNYVVDDVLYNSKSYLWWKTNSSSKDVEVGKSVDIYYKISNPNEADVYHNSFLLLFLSMVMIIFPPIILVKRFKN